MITIQDNFLPEQVFRDLQDYANNVPFQLVKAGEKEFSVLETPRVLLDLLQIKGHFIVLTFIREAHAGFDNIERIHADGIIQNYKTSFARVLYLNEEDELEPHGTCFYDHHIHGQFLSEDATEEEFNRLIVEDSNEPAKWKMTDKVIGRPNRLLTYRSNLFHAKWPAKIEKGNRKVLVVFYADKNSI